MARFIYSVRMENTKRVNNPITDISEGYRKVALLHQEKNITYDLSDVLYDIKHYPFGAKALLFSETDALQGLSSMTSYFKPYRQVRK